MKITFCSPAGLKFEDYINENLLGIEFQIFGLAKELVKSGHEIYIVRRWYAGSPRNECIKGINVINVPSPSLPSRIFEKLLFSICAKKEIISIRTDILILTDFFTSEFITSLNIPKIFVIHNPLINFQDNAVKKYIKSKIEHRTFNRCNIIIALNSTSSEYLHTHGYNSKIIPNGLDIKKYEMSKISSNDIFFAGRLVKIKGTSILLSAYSLLEEDLRNKHKLVIGGYGPEKETLEKMAIKYNIVNNVEFIPWLKSNEFIQKLKECSIFVLPSLRETFPVSLLEAMACGKTVIASDIPGPNDIIKNGHNGLLFESNNVSSLKEKIERCLTDIDLSVKMGINARDTIEKQYTFDNIAKQYDNVFNSIIGNKNERN